MKKSVCQMVDEAEKDEKAGAEFYKELAGKLDKGMKESKNSVLQISADEAGHLKEMQELKHMLGCKKSR